MASDQSGERYSWLEARAVRNASDIVLGGVLLAAAAAAILGSRGLSFGTWREPGAGFFPTVVAALLASIGILLLARGALRRASHMRWTERQIVLVAEVCLAIDMVLGGYLLLVAAEVAWQEPDPRFFPAVIAAVLAFVGILLLAWRTRQIVLVAVVIIALSFGGWLSGVNLATLFGLFAPQEHAALLVLALSIAIALAPLSRLRAAGMVLLGLLLPIVGLDQVTGQLRLTMGLEQLLPGFDFLVVAPGLILVAECLVCLFSPALLLATYTRRVAGWRDPAVSMIAAIGMRVVAVLVIAASCYLAFRVMERIWDIGLLWLFGAIGVACKVFGWNRLVLLLGFSCSVLLEQTTMQTMLVLGGDPTGVLKSPISATLLAAAACILVVAWVLSLRRALTRNAAGAAAA
jgi:Tripartite tricarboxylate transporter TctA family